MTSKELVLKLIEGRIETMQTLAIEIIELLYNAGYNEAIEAAAKWHDNRADIEKDISRSSSMAENYAANEIRKLKNESLI